MISVGRDNTYGHPSENTLNKLKGKTIFQTDREGNVVAISDGHGISFITQNSGKMENPAPADESSAISAKPIVYIGNTKTKKFHLTSCSGLPKADNQTTFETRDDAVGQGYTPCGICKP